METGRSEKWRYDDLAYRRDAGPMTPQRAFTVAQVMAYRLRDAGIDPDVRAALEELARAIAEVGRSWENEGRT